MVNKWEKVGVTVIAKIGKQGSGFYIRIPKPIVDAYGLKSGDNLKVKVEELQKFGDIGLKESDADKTGGL